MFHTDLWQHRGAGHPIEGRGILAEFHRGTDGITAWASTQKAHDLFQTITSLFDIDESKLRVITPEIGGGFGPKLCIYSEDIAVVAAAKLLQRSIKWIEDRREHFTNAAQERDQYWSIDIAVSDDAKVLGIRGNLVHDVGAFALQDVNIPFNSASMMSGPYIVPSLHMDVVVAATNKTPVSSIRGAGYPQAAFSMERMMDRIARELKLDRAEVRRAQSDPHGEDALHQAAEGALRRGHAIRQRRLSGLAGGGAQGRRLGRFPEAPGRGTGAGPLYRHRPRARHQGHRPRTVRVRHRARVEHRQGHGVHRRRQPRTGTAHGAGADLPPANSACARKTSPWCPAIPSGAPLGLGAFASRQMVTAGNLGAARVAAGRREGEEARQPSARSRRARSRIEGRRGARGRRARAVGQARRAVAHPARARPATASRPASNPASMPTSTGAPTRWPMPIPAMPPRSRSTSRPARCAF